MSDEALMQMIADAAGLGDEQAQAQLDLLRARKLRDQVRAPKSYDTPGAALGGGIADIIYGVRSGRDEARAQAAGAVADQKRNALVRALAGKTGMDAPQYRALSRALMGPGDPTLAAIGKGYETEAGAMDKSELEAAKQEAANYRAILGINKPQFINTPGDVNNSGVVFSPGLKPDLTHDSTVAPYGEARKTAGGVAAEITMSPDALRQQAIRYEATGQHGISARQTGNLSEMFNIHAQMFPNSDLIGNAANYKAGAGSLNYQTKQKSQLEIAHGTLLANMKPVEDLLDQIPNTGNMTGNAIARWIGRNMGSAKLAAFNTALQTISVEAGKILTQGLASGAALSEGARKEMEAIHSGNFTPAQLRSVMNVIKQDAENRRRVQEEELEATKKRVGAKPSPSTRAPAVPTTQPMVEPGGVPAPGPAPRARRARPAALDEYR